MTSSLVILLSYLVVTLCVSRWYGKRLTSSLSEDSDTAFFVGGKFLTTPLLVFTLIATYTSASSFIGGSAAAYEFGLGWVWLAMIQVPVAMLTLGCLGKRMMDARVSQNHTLIQWLDSHFNYKPLRLLTSVSLLIGFLAMMVVQLIAGARLLEGVAGIAYEQGLLLFAMTVLLYTLMGGFRSVVVTDAVQGLLMLVGLFIIAAVLLYQLSSFDHVSALLIAHDPALLQPHSIDQFISWPMLLSFWVLIGFGTLGLPHTVVRLLSVKNTDVLKKSMLWGTAIAFLMMFLPHFIGVLGRAYAIQFELQLDSPDLIIPVLISQLFPAWLGCFLLAAPIAAVMSSVDSMLLQSSATMIKDLYLMRQPNLSARKQMHLTRFSMAVLMGLVILLAIYPPKMIIWLNLMAFGALQVVFLWPVLASVFWPNIPAKTVFMSVALGLLSYLLFHLMPWKPAGMHPVMPSLALSSIVFIRYRYKKPAVEKRDCLHESQAS